MNQFDFIDISITDVLDILLVALLLFYLYKLVKGTVAINIFIGIVIIYFIWKITDLLNLDVLSNILGNFISVGFFALIVVFQQEIRKFLLLIGSTNFASRRNVIKYFNFLNQDKSLLKVNLTVLLSSCEKMALEKTGAIIVLERENSLEFVKETGEKVNIELTKEILETIFFKNSPLHDGAIIIKDNFVTATRVVLPVSESSSIPTRFGLRHRAGFGITEKTDALAIVISEQSGKISYIKNGEFYSFKNIDDLRRLLTEDLLI
ncbi:MAG: diadenylate cyclase CdaA [Bacteroidota bacterium]|nr:diadenylate cyclase CdaA [Bacteroidota bacterium]